MRCKKIGKVSERYKFFYAIKGRGYWIWKKLINVKCCKVILGQNTNVCSIIGMYESIWKYVIKTVISMLNKLLKSFMKIFKNEHKFA